MSDIKLQVHGESVHVNGNRVSHGTPVGAGRKITSVGVDSSLRVDFTDLPGLAVLANRDPESGMIHVLISVEALPETDIQQETGEAILDVCIGEYAVYRNEGFGMLTTTVETIPETPFVVVENHTYEVSAVSPEQAHRKMASVKRSVPKNLDIKEIAEPFRTYNPKGN